MFVCSHLSCICIHIIFLPMTVGAPNQKVITSYISPSSNFPPSLASLIFPLCWVVRISIQIHCNISHLEGNNPVSSLSLCPVISPHPLTPFLHQTFIPTISPKQLLSSHQWCSCFKIQWPISFVWHCLWIDNFSPLWNSLNFITSSFSAGCFFSSVLARPFLFCWLLTVGILQGRVFESFLCLHSLSVISSQVAFYKLMTLKFLSLAIASPWTSDSYVQSFCLYLPWMSN